MNTSPYSDEELMAYADGELEANRAGQIHRACLDDAQVASRVEMFRASRRLLTDAFEPVMQEPVPDRLLETIRGFDEQKLHSLGTASRASAPRAATVRRRARFMPAIAASITAIGAFTAGWFVHTVPSLPGTSAGFVAGVAPLADSVQVALERTASGNMVHGRIGGSAVDIVPLSTFSDGHAYCREFDVTPTGNGSAATLRGVACRDGQQWVARVMSGQAGHTVADDSYQTASGGSDLSRMVAHSAPVSSDQERDLIASGWKTR